MEIRLATVDDLEAVRSFLAAADLPNGDVTSQMLVDFLLAADDDNALIGCIGLERFGASALFRSLAVSPSARGAGYGKRLVRLIENLANSTGVSALFLLTTTASEYFVNLGFSVVDRDTAPAALQSSSQFAGLCHATAVCLRKMLS